MTLWDEFRRDWEFWVFTAFVVVFTVWLWLPILLWAVR